MPERVLEFVLHPVVDSAPVAPSTTLTNRGKSTATLAVKLMVNVPVFDVSLQAIEAMFVAPELVIVVLFVAANRPFAANEDADESSHTGAVPLLCNVLPFAPRPSETHAEPLKYAREPDVATDGSRPVSDLHSILPPESVANSLSGPSVVN
jgi:hypothetical protein